MTVTIKHGTPYVPAAPAVPTTATLTLHQALRTAAVGKFTDYTKGL